jgi:hypothetical protein
MPSSLRNIPFHFTPDNDDDFYYIVVDNIFSEDTDKVIELSVYHQWKQNVTLYRTATREVRRTLAEQWFGY